MRFIEANVSNRPIRRRLTAVGGLVQALMLVLTRRWGRRHLSLVPFSRALGGIERLATAAPGRELSVGDRLAEPRLSCRGCHWRDGRLRCCLRTAPCCFRSCSRPTVSGRTRACWCCTSRSDSTATCAASPGASRRPVRGHVPGSLLAWLSSLSGSTSARPAAARSWARAAPPSCPSRCAPASSASLPVADTGGPPSTQDTPASAGS
jgi:hypothetical protein